MSRICTGVNIAWTAFSNWIRGSGIVDAKSWAAHETGGDSEATWADFATAGANPTTWADLET